MRPDDFPIPLRPGRAIELSAAFVHEMAGDRRLDYTPESLRQLDPILERALAIAGPQRRMVVTLLASFYLGEVIVQTLGPDRAGWVRADEAARQRLGPCPVHLRLDRRHLCLWSVVQAAVADGPPLATFVAQVLPDSAAQPARHPLARLRALLGFGPGQLAA